MKRPASCARNLIARRPGRAPLPGDLVRALDWLKPRLAEPIDLDALAQAAGVPARTLEAHFRTYLGITPLGWVRQTRLAHARQQLLRGDRSVSITEIALASGFSQFGRFAGRYRELYGELPSQTQARASRSASESDPIDDEALFRSWRALAAAYAVAPRQCGTALDDAARAQELAPALALPQGIITWCYGQRAALNFNGLPSIERARIAQLAAEAVALAPSDPLTLNVSSGAMALAHRLHEADRMIERAIALDPWSPLNWIRRGWVSAYLGDSHAAIRELNIVLHLVPFAPMCHVAFIGIGCAHFAAGRYDRAARWTREGVVSQPGSFWADRIAAAAAVHYGARDEARRIARRLLRKDPSLTVAAARDALPFTAQFIDRLGDGLQTAGVPQ
jgi:AraC-like DNA-binding protein